MPVFEYKGFDAKGGAVKGVFEADNAKTARTKLRRQGVFPTDIKEQTSQATTGQGLNTEIDVAAWFEFISVRDVATMTTQLATLLGASVPMGESLAALVDQTEKKKLRVILAKIRERVNEGATLGDAMADHPKVFDELYISMVRAGERTGSLADVLKRLAVFADAQVKLQGQIASAVAYPALMSIIGIVMIIGLFIGVIPRIRGLFESLGGESQLPLLTRVVFFFGDFLVSYWWLPPIFVFAAFEAWRRWVKTKAGRDRWDRILLVLPILGRVNRLVAVSRFARTLSTLLLSGVPILAALAIVRDVVGNTIIAAAVQAAAANIQEGQSIATPLKESGQFPPMVTHMISIGERTGELERMLSVVSDSYDSQVEATMNALTSILGPLLIMVMGGIIFIVALGLLMPMMNISSMIRNS
jgi:general secretion pathway protein F